MIAVPIVKLLSSVQHPSDMVAVPIVKLLLYPTSQWHDGSAHCQIVSSVQPPNDMMAVPVISPISPISPPSGLLYQWALPALIFYPTSQWHDGSAYCQTFSSIQPPNDTMAVPIVKLSLPSSLPMIRWQCLLSNCLFHPPPNDMTAVPIVKLLFHSTSQWHDGSAYCQTFSSIQPPSDMMAVPIVKLLFHPTSQWHDGSAFVKLSLPLIPTPPML